MMPNFRIKPWFILSRQFNWEESFFTLVNDIDEMADFFTNKYLEMAKECIPTDSLTTISLVTGFIKGGITVERQLPITFFTSDQNAFGLNHSLRISKYPSCWKIANVLSLFKKGDKSIASNYRPIALLSCVGKVFERIVFKYIYNYMLEHKLLYKFQSGFVSGHSTSHQLIELYHKICIA
jgi:hypothetical protein